MHNFPHMGLSFGKEQHFRHLGCNSDGTCSTGEKKKSVEDARVTTDVFFSRRFVCLRFESLRSLTSQRSR